jgi:hypothetical protein
MVTQYNSFEDIENLEKAKENAAKDKEYENKKVSHEDLQETKKKAGKIF